MILHRVLEITSGLLFAKLKSCSLQKRRCSVHRR